MKKIILSFVLLSFQQCISQNTIFRDSLILINNNFEVLDSIRYIKDFKAFNTIKMKNGTIISIVKYVSGRYTYRETRLHSYFIIKKTYYSNKNIKDKGVSNLFRKGIWYFFNEDGTLSHQIDYDAPFKFTWQDILEYCREHNIVLKMQRKYHFRYSVPIRRYSEGPNYTGVPVWVIEHYLPEKSKIETIYLDGVTGKEIKRLYRIGRTKVCGYRRKK